MKGTYRSLKALVHWQEAERPIDWATRFGRTAPLEIEIGFGNGEYLIKQALENPDRNYVGVELHWESVKRLLRRIHYTGAGNIRVLLGDAPVVLDRLFKPRSAERIYSLFPCPWPKERHTRHRLFSTKFFRLMNSRIVDHGDAQIVTDHEQYFEWICGQLPGCGFAFEWKTTPPAYDTKYERKWEAGGKQLYFDLQLRKDVHEDLPFKEDVELKTYRIEHFDPDSFEPADVYGKVVVAFKDFLFDREREKGILKAVVAEEDLHQTVWIEIARTGKSWMIRPVQGGGALPTVGLQTALDQVKKATDPA